MKTYTVWAIVEQCGRLFDHAFNITILDNETMNGDIFKKYAHIKMGWIINKITAVQEITNTGKYIDSKLFDF
jgi:hypothetical protein